MPRLHKGHRPTHYQMRCDLGPIDVCGACYNKYYRGTPVQKSPDYECGEFVCIDCGKPLTSDDDLVMAQRRKSLVSNLPFALRFWGAYALVSAAAFGVGFAVAHITHNLNTAFWFGLVAYMVGFFALSVVLVRWLIGEIRSRREYSIPDFVNIETPELAEPPDA